MKPSNKIKIRMLSVSDIVKGQGVSSAFHEQVSLVSQSDLLDVRVNEPFKDADIVHFHTIDPFGYFKLFNKKYINVVYVHVLAEKLAGSIKLNRLAYKFFKAYTHKFYKKADYLVIVNPNTKDTLLSFGVDKEKIYYIPNYVDNEMFHTLKNDKVLEIRNKHGFSKDDFIVLSVGQVLINKGVRDFMKVAKQNPHITFVWAGGFSFGKLTEGYEELNDYVNNPLPNVKFLGIVERDLMNEIYNMSDVLFMPSLNEMFPMTILEALNANKPLVLRDLQLYEDIFFDKYRKCKNVDDFNNEILKLKEDSDYYNKSKDNSIFLSNHYSRDYTLKLWEDFYSEIVQRRKNVI